MKDIDFDELDRAVTSLMSGVPKTEPPKQDTMKTLAYDSPADERKVEPAQDIITVNNSPRRSDDRFSVEERSKPSSHSMPAPRQRGQFMDMVRATPPEVKSPVPVRVQSRQGLSVQPSSPLPSLTASPIPAPRTIQPESKKWPDSLEDVDFNETTEAVTARDRQVETPSPFLPDAKVEKRPLGRSSESDAVSDDPLGLDYIASPKVSGGTADFTPSETVTGDAKPLPLELGRDVIEIESDDADIYQETVKPPIDVRSVPLSVSPPPRAAATSIPQQYKVKPKVSETASGAIYDTAAYHQPLSHPAKKKSGWLWVVAIIGILLLGAGSGAAVYFLGLI